MAPHNFGAGTRPASTMTMVAPASKDGGAYNLRPCDPARIRDMSWISCERHEDCAQAQEHYNAADQEHQDFIRNVFGRNRGERRRDDPADDETGDDGPQAQANGEEESRRYDQSDEKLGKIDRADGGARGG